MNILSINIRGGGSIVKRKRLAHLIQSGKVDIFFVQETKLSGVDLKMTVSLWGGGGDDSVEWNEAGSVGASGRIIILWRKELLKLLFSFRGIDFVGVNAE
ncbi:unnamed protein product [Lathyrus sativus]|nr:unnamed protein product [Lathyrus sativus]